MRKFALAFAALMLFFAGCSKEDGSSGNEPNNPQNPTPTAPKIEIAEADKTINFSKEAGERSISFTASESWTATPINDRADGWLTVSPASGAAGFASIKLTVTENTTPDERSASVQIKSGSATVTIVVTQKQQDALTVTQSRFDVGAAEGSITVVVAANVNVECSVASSASSWIHPSQDTRAMTTSQFKFTIGPNTTSNKREGAITVYGNGLSETIMVYQAKGDGGNDGDDDNKGGNNGDNNSDDDNKGGNNGDDDNNGGNGGNGGTDPDDPNGGGDNPNQPETPSIVVSTNNITLTSAAQSFAVEVNHNVDVAYEISGGGQWWLSHADTRAMSTNTYYFNAEENSDITERTATIKFTNYATGTSETVQVTQQGTSPTLIVSEKSVTLAWDEHNFDVVVSRNVDVELVEISANAQSWLSHTGTRAMPSETYSFFATDNDSQYDRKATITFTNKERGLSETVEVTQFGFNSQTAGNTVIFTAGTTMTSISESQGDISFSTDTNGGSAAPAYNTNYDELRIYRYNGLNIKAAFGHILRIVITFSDTSYMGSDFGPKDSSGTYSTSGTTGIWTGSAPEVKFVNKGTTNIQARIKNIAVTYDRNSAFGDPLFREYLLAHFDKNGDGKFSEEEARSVRSIDISKSGITSLKGIEYFTNLKSLDCRSTKLTELDVSKNTALTELYCNDNKLRTLNVSQNTALKILWCGSDPLLTSLDVSKNTALTELRCTGSKLRTLDVSKNTELKTLYCYSNQLTTLDVSGCTALTELFCYFNQLTSLDVSGCTALTYLNCYSNQLTSLDVSKNTALDRLSCGSNQLTELNVQNTALTELYCGGNQLTTLDVSKTKLGNSNYSYPLMCSSMSTLTTLYLKEGWTINGINKNRSTNYIPSQTKIIYK